MRPGPNPPLPPNLRQVCAILAAGLVRLRGHTAEELAREAAGAGGLAEGSLHFLARQSGHATPPPRRDA